MEEVLAGSLGPVLIFLLRICDVSIATFRLLSMIRGRKLATVVLAFFEILIWIVAVGVVVRHLSSPVLVVSYAAGFAAGTFVGMSLEERFALGLAEIRIVSRMAGQEIADALRGRGHGVTELSGWGREGPVDVLTTIVRRRALKDVLREVRHWDDDAFVTVDEPRQIQRGWLLAYRRK